MVELEEYKKKRNFGKTPEPSANDFRLNKSRDGKRLRFVIQKHRASRLHYDFRLENKDGVLKSWAVPKGVSLDPSIKRLAVMVEDHPGSYIDFEGEIPEGNYGAGTVIVWDTGQYSSDPDIDQQLKNGIIKFTLFGEKARGGFSLIKTKKEENHWILFKEKDEYASTENITDAMPNSVLSGKIIERKDSDSAKKTKSNLPKGVPKDFPSMVKPMLAMSVDEAFDRRDWVYEVKWDGVRAILFQNKSDGILHVKSRKGNEISHRYPEIVTSVDSLIHCHNSVVLDGEIVVMNNQGVPDFELHQARMNIDDRREIAGLSSTNPATYYVFDILYLDGLSLEQLEFIQRRKILSSVVSAGAGPIRISEFFESNGKEVFKNAISMKLEGILAKYKFSTYQQGSRSSAWLKIKGVLTQDCVVIGYTKGEGNRERLFGSLILAASENGKLKFVGHSGSGFGFDQLEEALKMMQPLIVDQCPIESIPYVNQEPVWLKPELVVEVKFHGWTQELIMRAPIFMRFRDDKTPDECIIENPKDTGKIIDNVAALNSDKDTDDTLVEESFSNLQKVYWPASSSNNDRALTKQDLIDYYDSIGHYILPHLRDRPLSLSRYPDGIYGKTFYHKNWEQTKPDFVRMAKVFSESSQRVINYLICNNKESLLWLANLGCIEMHPWYSRIHDFSVGRKAAKTSTAESESVLEEVECGLNAPDFIIVDLDPYIYSGREPQGGEPEYNTKAFEAVVEVALMLKDFLESLKIRSYVKTSGKTGLHIFIPIAPDYTYDQTRAFAEVVGKILISKATSKVTMEWSTEKRRDKVFFDFKQNAMGKTIASVLSARPTASATVSMPLNWNELHKVLPTDFTILNVREILKRRGDAWHDILDSKQDLAKMLDDISGP